jgi:hypothetical protein
VLPKTHVNHCILLVKLKSLDAYIVNCLKMVGKHLLLVDRENRGIFLCFRQRFKNYVGKSKNKKFVNCVLEKDSLSLHKSVVNFSH